MDCKISHCKSCITGSSDICLECDSGYALALNNCYKCSDDNCINCKNSIFKCTLCKEDYFVTHNDSCDSLSFSCLKNCKKCLDSVICAEYSMNERFLDDNSNNSNKIPS